MLSLSTVNFPEKNSAFIKASPNLLVFGLLSNEGVGLWSLGSCLSPELRSSHVQKGGTLLALTRCPVLYTNTPLFARPATDMAVSEMPQHAGHAKSHLSLSLCLGLLPPRTPGAVSISHPTCQQHPGELGNPSSELLHRKLFGHCKYLLAYHFAHTSAQRGHYPWDFTVSFYEETWHLSQDDDTLCTQSSALQWCINLYVDREKHV